MSCSSLRSQIRSDLTSGWTDHDMELYRASRWGVDGTRFTTHRTLHDPSTNVLSSDTCQPTQSIWQFCSQCLNCRQLIWRIVAPLPIYMRKANRAILVTIWASCPTEGLVNTHSAGFHGIQWRHHKPQYPLSSPAHPPRKTIPVAIMWLISYSRGVGAAPRVYERPYACSGCKRLACDCLWDCQRQPWRIKGWISCKSFGMEPGKTSKAGELPFSWSVASVLCNLANSTGSCWNIVTWRTRLNCITTGRMYRTWASVLGDDAADVRGADVFVGKITSSFWLWPETGESRLLGFLSWMTFITLCSFRRFPICFAQTAHWMPASNGMRYGLKCIHLFAVNDEIDLDFRKQMTVMDHKSCDRAFGLLFSGHCKDLIAELINMFLFHYHICEFPTNGIFALELPSICACVGV